ncbi:mannose-1-phosphate guanylyltransferase [Bacillus cereus]|nr:mannose-1-phosphate guanylyltransferase [Bacillus cereus]
MNIVLLSGGSGKRLFPLSQDHRAKQFIKIFQDDNHSSPYSLIQRVWQQAKANCPESKVVIATTDEQVGTIENQLNYEATIVVEPERRDTFPAIALALAYYKDQLDVDPKEPIVVMPVDGYYHDTFYESVKKLYDAVASNPDIKVGVIGVKPTDPSTQYGYILPMDKTAGLPFYQVKSFKEKPSKSVASMLIKENGAYWNCGVFCTSPDYYDQVLRQHGHKLDYQYLLEHYSELEKISVDYQVIEPCQSTAMVVHKSYWKDLGTWTSLTGHITSGTIGKGQQFNSEDTNIINELSVPVYTVGTKNLVVTASPDGILVLDKDKDYMMKSVASSVQSSRPMYEERKWGWYRVLEHFKNDDNDEVLVKRIALDPEKAISYQKHYKRSEVWTITKGRGMFIKNNTLQEVYPGVTVSIPTESWHAIKNLSDSEPLEFVEVQQGSQLIEEDIIRKDFDWDLALNASKEASRNR